jgi:hypothetical protein
VDECEPPQVVLCVLVVVKESDPNKGEVRLYPGTNMEVTMMEAKAVIGHIQNSLLESCWL